MKLQTRGSIICLVSLISVPYIFCEEISNTTEAIRWTCICSSKRMNQRDIIQSNCSTPCNCSPVGGASEDSWTCICDGDGLPKIASNDNKNCFTACNCTSGSGSMDEIPTSGKHKSTRAVVLVLLLCVILTAFAFLTSIMCYFYRKEKCPIQAPVFSSNKEASSNSATNLISHKTFTVPATKRNISSPFKFFIGCFYRDFFLFKSKPGNILGTIYQYSYCDLECATDNFSNANLIGLGGSSYVYCGQLKDGKIVAIKRLKGQGGRDADSIFFTEVDLLSRLNHCHVVPLLGYCSESRGKHVERLLVFEYMPNGNLRDCLDGAIGENMNWDSRVLTAIGAARGLEYLHEAAAPRILHRDVKSTNILLDANWRAKITDLGMAKYLKVDGLPSCPSSPARMQGTFGYFAPEYAIVGRASFKSDVFSFGVVLLELITGRQPIHKSMEKGEESLVIWATPRLQDSQRVISELPDPRLKGQFSEEEMQIMAYLAKECLLLDPDARPTMSEVVQILSTIAPDKSRMRNLFQWPSNSSMNPEQDEQKPESLVMSPVAAEELTKVTSSRWSSRCSLPLDIESNLCGGSFRNKADDTSSEYIEKLILLSSRARSWRTQDNEIVDLNEPRFESFCVANLSPQGRTT